jgi:hypothetical protein
MLLLSLLGEQIATKRKTLGLIRFGHEGHKLAYLKGKDAEAEEA